MGRTPKRRKVGTTGAGDPLRVAIAGREESIYTYRKRLIRSENNVVELLQLLDKSHGVRQTRSHIDRHISALCCGRILGVNSNSIGERCYYCDQSSLCECCQHQRARQRARQIGDCIPSNSPDRFFDAYLSTRMPTSHDNEIEYLKFLNVAKRRLSRRLNAIRAESHDWFPLRNYWIGIHSKPMNDSPLQLPHMHLGFLTGPACDSKQIIQKIEDYWRKTTVRQFGCSARIEFERKGAKITRATRPRKDSISVEHFENLIAYIMCTTEENDTAQSSAHRNRLFRAARIGHSFSRARSAGLLPQLPTKSHFDPVALGKKFIVVFPFSQAGWILLPAQEYLQQKAMLEEQAKSLVYSIIPYSIKQHLK